MRSVPLLALLVSSVSLAACGGGGAGGGLSASASLASLTEVCGVNDTGAGCNPTTGGGTTGGGTTGGGTTGGGTTGGGTTGGGTGTGGTNTGNTGRLTTGDKTIILEKSKLMATEANPGLSRLTIGATPSTAKLLIDTKLADDLNAKWPLAKDLEEYVYGTNLDDTSIAIRNLGGTYKEYRALSYNTDGTSADEVLQVWNWGYSYGTQYRDLTIGGEAGHQAWSFGGTKTLASAMPTTGIVNYNGRYGATAKTSNWLDPNNGRIVSANNIWRVTGAATGTADFASGSFEATLTPEIWNAYATLNGGQGFTNVSAGGVNDAANSLADANYNPYMNDLIKLKGTISTLGASGNTITGNATMQTVQTATSTDNAWITNTSVNPFYGAFFGPAADEVTGVFNLEAVDPFPAGGNIPVNDDRRGFIQQSGVFNVQ